MSIESDPLLNSTTRTRRSVDILTLLNKASFDTCRVYELHLNTIMKIGLSLKEPNPKFGEDHAAVFKGLHDFALQSHQLATQFELYSQVAFSHLLKYGIEPNEENETTDNRANVLVNQNRRPQTSSLLDTCMDIEKIPLPGEVITNNVAPRIFDTRKDHGYNPYKVRKTRSSSTLRHGHDTFSSNSPNTSLRRGHDGSERHTTPKRAHY